MSNPNRPAPPPLPPAPPTGPGSPQEVPPLPGTFPVDPATLPDAIRDELQRLCVILHTKDLPELRRDLFLPPDISLNLTCQRG